jgi:hypothetical protein
MAHAIQKKRRRDLVDSHNCVYTLGNTLLLHTVGANFLAAHAIVSSSAIFLIGISVAAAFSKSCLDLVGVGLALGLRRRLLRFPLGNPNSQALEEEALGNRNHLQLHPLVVVVVVVDLLNLPLVQLLLNPLEVLHHHPCNNNNNNNHLDHPPEQQVRLEVYSHQHNSSLLE